METKIIKVSEYIEWNGWFWRQTGNKIREIFAEDYKRWKSIELNFDGVMLASHSFIDELIWIFYLFDKEDALKRIKFSNCNHIIKEKISFVVHDRINRKDKELA